EPAMAEFRFACVVSYLVVLESCGFPRPLDIATSDAADSDVSAAGDSPTCFGQALPMAGPGTLATTLSAAMEAGRRPPRMRPGLRDELPDDVAEDRGDDRERTVAGKALVARSQLDVRRWRVGDNDFGDRATQRLDRRPGGTDRRDVPGDAAA